MNFFSCDEPARCTRTITEKEKKRLVRCASRLTNMVRGAMACIRPLRFSRWNVHTQAVCGVLKPYTYGSLMNLLDEIADHSNDELGSGASRFTLSATERCRTACWHRQLFFSSLLKHRAVVCRLLRNTSRERNR